MDIYLQQFVVVLGAVKTVENGGNHGITGKDAPCFLWKTDWIINSLSGIYSIRPR